MMTEHAPPIALRIGLAASAAAVAATVFDTGKLNWLDLTLATVLGVIFWAFAYIFVYVAEQWFYETGRLTRPIWLEPAETKPDLDTVKVPVREQPAADSTPVPRGVPATIPIGIWEKLAIAIRDKGMTHMSKRQLESYGIVSDRTSEDADALLWFFVHKNLVKDVGNSQYEVTDETKKFLETFTGVKFDVERV